MRALVVIVMLAAVVAGSAEVRAGEPESPGEQFVLGYRYLTGDGVERDPTQASRYILRAARAGEPQAQFQAGVMFMDGLGLPKDAMWAWYWLDQSVKSPSLPQLAREQAKGRLDALSRVLTKVEKRRLGLKE